MTPIKKIKSISPRAFTLIELIVVVTILAILGAIGFVTMTGYFAGARDSARLSDMNNIYTQLNLTAGMDGLLPYPDNYRALSMSGTAPSNIIIYQGYAAKPVLTTIKFEKGGRDPKDDVYYTYTTDKKRKQAQLMGYFEEYDTTKLSNVVNIVPKTYAATVTDYSDRKIGTLGKMIGTLVESTTFIPVQQTSTGTLDIAAATSTGYVAYFDSTTTGSGAGTALSSAYVSNSVVYNSGEVMTNISATITPFASCTAAGQVYASSTTYPGTATFPGACSDPDKILCTGAGTGQIWSMCNVGATTTTNYNSTATDRTSLASVDGKLFQFARNDGFDAFGAVPTVVGGSSVATNVFNGEMATKWYYGGLSSNFDWRITQLSTATDVTANIWIISPCDIHYHVPTQSEFQTAYNIFSSTTYGNIANLPTILKMPFVGYLNYSDASLNYQGSYGKYWSSSPNSTYSLYVQFLSNSIDSGNNSDRANGYSVRCIKN